MKKVIIISSTFSRDKKGGVASFVDNRAKYLSKKVDVIVCALGTTSYNDTNIAYKSIGNPLLFKYYFIIYWARLILFCFKQKDAVIEIHNIPVAFPVFFIFRNRYFFHGPARQEAQVENKPLMIQYSSYLLELVSLKLSNKIFVVSNFFRKTLQEEHPHIKSRILKKLPIYEYQEHFFDPNSIPSDGLNFVMVRRLVKRTGVLEFVALFIKMLETNNLQNNAILTIAGDGPEREKIIELIAKSKFEKNISCVGIISEQKKIELFQRADYNIVPTLKLEGFGLVIIEAAICGCKSIVTNVGAMPEVIAYLSHQGHIFELDNEGPSMNMFKSLKKNAYDKKQLHNLTKDFFFFESN